MFWQYILNHIQYVLLALSLVSGAIVPFTYGVYIYAVGLIYSVFFSILNNNNNLFIGRYFILFLIACLLSNIASDSINYRLFAFILIIISFTPITISSKLFDFRKKYLKHCLMIFPLLSIISLFCFIYGINYYAEKQNALDFSAIFAHPMWMGAAIGLSNIVTLWLFFDVNKSCYRFLYLIVLLLSIYVTIVSGSRSAFFSSLITMVFFLIIKLRNIKSIILVGCIITIISIITLPLYMSGAERMVKKFEENKGVYGSRTELFTTGVRHYKETPVFGVGFAVSYNAKGEKKIGKMESGSGWLSILFQTGLLGFSIICLMLGRVYKVFRYVRKDNELLLFMFSFIYLCLHSFFEGYILTIGYYPCILFWCLLGYLYTYSYANTLQTSENN